MDKSAKKKKRLRAECDRLWHLAVIKEYGERCFFTGSSKSAQACLKTTATCHHIKAKGQYGHLRYYIPNGLPVCWPCHYKLEKVDRSMILDVIVKRGKSWYNDLEAKAKETPASYQTIKYYSDTIERLKILWKRKKSK